MKNSGELRRRKVSCDVVDVFALCDATISFFKRVLVSGFLVLLL